MAMQKNSGVITHLVALAVGGLLVFWIAGGRVPSVPDLASYLFLIFMAALGAIVLWKLATNHIDLKEVLEEESGGASLSRFQFLIFTFVIAIAYAILLLKGIDKIIASNPIELPKIPNEVLGLIGISGGSYLVSKGIQKTGAGGGQVQPPQG